MAAARGRGPSAGDLSICFDCGRVRRFNDKLVLEPVALSSLPEDVRQKTLAMYQRRPRRSA
jgi:hypothetical protein